VNGSRVEPLERDGLVAINVPAGHSVVEIRYRNWSLRLFWTMLVIYVLAGVWLAALAIRVAWRSRRAGFASPGVSGER
jgi:predicted ferric reductase